MSWSQNPVILRFDEVSFFYDDKKKILIETSFSLRENTKIAIMGQNGAWKSTICKLITKELKPQKWQIHIKQWSTIAVSKQVIPRNQLSLSMRDYFATAFVSKEYQIDRKIEQVLEAVNLVTSDYDKLLKDFSGGQQARLLLAYALIQKPDILLLDEPTNNLDKNGINHLIWFLLTYEKTVVVISHDTDFLNMFTDWVLYLNSITNQIEQYRGDYYDVVEQINAQIEKEKTQNARAEKQILDAKEKINFFANKGGKMRKLASKMKDEVIEAESTKVIVRKEDRTINAFQIEFENLTWPIVSISNLTLMMHGDIVSKNVNLILKKWDRILIVWPNGIGKSTLLKRLVYTQDEGATIHDGVKVWYYSQDFNALDMQMNVRDALQEASDMITDEQIYRTAAQFLLTSDILKNKIVALSEGQKWLLCYARFVLQKPHLLILDEPTNHINFRHLPVIAQALNQYQWAMIIVSHDQWFVDQLKDIQELYLEKI